jgi:hypothetical protein
MRRYLLAAGLLIVVTLGLRMLMAGSGAGVFAPGPSGELPADWGITRYGGDPVIDVDNNPNESTEQYTPAPIRLPNGDIWIYVKGAEDVYAWLSTDDGETFALQNGNDPVIEPTPAAWDSSFALEPVATYDPDIDTIHLYYKGRAGANTWAWGHATADGSDPTTFTKDPANPILTSATVITALGGGTMRDLAISDVVKIGDTFHFYGYASHSNVYKLIQATGNDWDNPSGVEAIQNPPGGMTVVQSPSVFTINGLYAMFYSVGGAQPAPRWVRVASSTDGETWDFSDTTNIISPQGTGWEEDEVYTGSVLKDGVGPEPLVVDGKMLFYYSGLETPPGDANVGLIYMEPS